ncbi:MAG: VOC family protein [Cyanobacteria bacterium J06638_20]
MTKIQPVSFPSIALSHFELYVEDIPSMEAFYTRHLGFVVTDRGEGDNAMIFLSRNPNEHHQLVLNPRQTHKPIESPVDHISFRIDSVTNLRVFYKALLASSTDLQTVSHGTTWSIYFRDPEGNRLELFTDTPWYVNQPCRFDIDFELSNEELFEFTENRIKDLPGFRKVNDWKASHIKAVNENDSD